MTSRHDCASETNGPITQAIQMSLSVVQNENMKTRARRRAVEAADAVDERNGRLAHSVLENAARFPQLPQPSSSARSQTEGSIRADHTLPTALRGLEYGVHLSNPNDRLAPPQPIPQKNPVLYRIFV
jgi:hypothetical protein